MLTLYYNQNCSKARGALALLDEHGVDYELHNYIDVPLNAAELTELIGLVGGDPADMVRGELADTSIESVVRHLVENPADMQRPIAVNNGRAVIGRPSERVLEVIDETDSGGDKNRAQ